MAYRTFHTKVRFNSVSGGLGDFVVGAAVSIAFKTPTQGLAKDGGSYGYFAQSADGVIFEQGIGIWDAGTNALIRDEVIDNHLGTTAVVNFASPPTIDMFPAANSYLESDFVATIIEAGSRAVFYQAAAPIGWTKVTSGVNDKAMRVVSGTGGGSGGTHAFSTVFSKTATDGFTLTIPTIPSHDHPYVDYTGAANVDGNSAGSIDYNPVPVGRTTSATGGSGSHAHGMDIRVQYLDVIICQKDAF